MQRISHPWPLSYISTGFCVMYSLASMCAWWCIHCPSGVGPDCHFYHFILSRINKLVYWVRQRRKFILFSLACAIISFPTHSDALTGGSSCFYRDPQTLGCASSVPGPWLRWIVIIALLQTFTSAKDEVKLLFWKLNHQFCTDVFIGCSCHVTWVSRDYRNLFILAIITCTCLC